MSQSRKRASDSADDSVAKNPEVSDNREFVEVLKKKTGNPERAIFLPANKAYIGVNDKIIAYDTVTMQEIREIAPNGGYIWDISQSRDGKSLFVACADGTARIINLFTGEEVILRGNTRFFTCIIQGEGIDVLTGSSDMTFRRWNSLTGECLKVYEGHTDRVYSILYDEATKRIFSASEDKTIIAWNSETGEKVRVMEGHGKWVMSLARVNSTTIASCSGDGTIKLWHMATFACIKTISNDCAVLSVAATPDGQHLIYGSYDNKVRVWSVATGQCLHTLSHHSNWVYRVAVSPDGRFIASGGGDGMVHLFSVSPPFSFPILKGALVHGGREQSLSLFSDGAIRDGRGDAIISVTSTSTCSLISEILFAVNDNGHVELTAPSISSAQLWSEAISAVAVDLALHPDDRVQSADQMIKRYRFNLLQTILIHRREPSALNWHIPREIVHIIAGHCFAGEQDTGTHR